MVAKDLMKLLGEGRFYNVRRNGNSAVQLIPCRPVFLLLCLYLEVYASPIVEYVADYGLSCIVVPSCLQCTIVFYMIKHDTCTVVNA